MQYCNLIANAFEKILKSAFSSVMGLQLLRRRRSWAFFGISITTPDLCSLDRQPCSCKCIMLSKKACCSWLQNAKQNSGVMPSEPGLLFLLSSLSAEWNSCRVKGWSISSLWDSETCGMSSLKTGISSKGMRSDGSSLYISEKYLVS